LNKPKQGIDQKDYGDNNPISNIVEEKTEYTSNH